MSDPLRDLKELLEKRKYSRKTIKAYIQWIKELQNYHNTEKVNELKFDEIREFANYLSEKRRLAPSSLKQAVCALQFFFKNIIKIDINLNDFKGGWISRPTPQIPTQSEVLKILDHVKNPIYELALALIYSTGLELNEARNIRVKDVDLLNNKIAIPLKRKRSVRHAIIAQRIRPQIVEQLNKRNHDEYLLTGRQKKQISESALQRAFKRARIKAGIFKPYSIRSLRHAYIKHLEYSGIPLVTIIEELGLSKLLSLDFYSKIGYPQIEITFSPLDRRISTDEGDRETGFEPYVSEKRLSVLTTINSSKFDLIRLLELLRELNLAHRNNSLMTIAMILRAIIDHVPPIFGYISFNEVVNNYKGSKSFKNSMNHMNNSLRNIADTYLHVVIRQKESIPTFTQIDFRADLDILLSEIIRILK